MTPTELSQVEQALTNALMQIRASFWPQAVSNPNPAKLSFQLLDQEDYVSVTGYDRQLDKIVVKLYEANARDVLNSAVVNPTPAPHGWIRWQGELVHELAHELQFKEQCPCTPAAQQLMAKWNMGLHAEGHDCIYFAALIEMANHAQMTPEDLLMSLAASRRPQ